MGYLQLWKKTSEEAQALTLLLGQLEKQHDRQGVRMDIKAWGQARTPYHPGLAPTSDYPPAEMGRARPAHPSTHHCHGLSHWLSNACNTSPLAGRDSNKSWRTILSTLQTVLGHTSLSLNSAQVQAAASQLKSMKLHPPTPDLNWLYE